MSIGGVMVFDPPAGGVAPTVEAVREHLAARLGELPRYSQRLSSARTGSLAWPQWVPDERFDIRHHVGHGELPAPGDDGQLSDWTAEFFSRPLDRTRPLWEMMLVEGLEGGRWALGWKTHHCLVDGVGSVDLIGLLLGPAPTARTEPASPRSASAGPSWRSHVPETVVQAAGAGAARRRRGGSRRGASQGGAGALAPGRPADRARRASRRAPHLAERADRTDAPVRRRARAAGGAESDRAPPRRIDHRRRAGGIHQRPAAVAALARGRAAVPRAARAGADQPARRIGPLDARQPAQLLVRGSPRRRATCGGAAAEDRCGYPSAEILGRGAGHLDDDRACCARPAGGGECGARADGVLQADVQRGGHQRAGFAGAAVRVRSVACARSNPVLPLLADHAVGVAALSYNGQVTFGINADAASTPDLDVLARGIAEGLEELRALLPDTAKIAGASR